MKFLISLGCCLTLHRTYILDFVEGQRWWLLQDSLLDLYYPKK